MRKPWKGLRSSLLRVPFVRQGAHPDPGDPNVVRPPLPDWAKDLVDSPAMKAFEDGLLTPGISDARAAVLEELSTYWKHDIDETLERCINWEDYSVAEWQQSDRDNHEGLLDFYQHCESWAYDLLWYDYMRANGFGIPAVVAIAQWLSERSAPGTHLDFGAGSGGASLMFDGLGWQSTMGDISMPLLDFARWRVQRRGRPIGDIDLREPLPTNTYDVVTAIDSFAHVPDAYLSARELHKAMRIDGYLFVNFDVREATDYNAWHLYSTSYGLQWDVRRAGFQHIATIAGGNMEVFRRVDDNTPGRKLQLAKDRWHYGPPSHIYWETRRKAWNGARRIAQRIWGQR